MVFLTALTNSTALSRPVNDGRSILASMFSSMKRLARRTVAVPRGSPDNAITNLSLQSVIVSIPAIIPRFLDHSVSLVLEYEFEYRQRSSKRYVIRHMRMTSDVGAEMAYRVRTRVELGEHSITNVRNKRILIATVLFRSWYGMCRLIAVTSQAATTVLMMNGTWTHSRRSDVSSIILYFCSASGLDLVRYPKFREP